MYKKQIQPKTTIVVNESVEGETIEQKIERVVNNGEPITDGAEITYTERKDGILPEYDIRTDRFDVALDATDKISASRLAEREKRLEQLNEEAGGKEGKKPNAEGKSEGNPQS